MTFLLPLMTLVQCLAPDMDYKLLGAQKHWETLLEESLDNSSIGFNLFFSVGRSNQNFSFQESAVFWMWNWIPVKCQPSSCQRMSSQCSYSAEWGLLQLQDPSCRYPTTWYNVNKQFPKSKGTLVKAVFKAAQPLCQNQTGWFII